MPGTDDIFHAIQRCDSATEVQSTLFAFFGEQGFGGVCFGTPSSTEHGALDFVHRGCREDFPAHYAEQRLDLNDPRLRVILAKGRPMLCSEIARQPCLSPREREVMAEFPRAGFTDALMIPTFGRGNAVGMFCLSDPRDDATLAQADLPLLQAVAQQGHLRLDQIAQKRTPPAVLSQREREILFWIAQHKSNTDIATILSVSPTTVATHVKRIFTKLEANDRMSAVGRGIESGQIWV